MKTLLYLTMGALLACPIMANAQSSTSTTTPPADTPPGPPPGERGGDGGPPGGGRHDMSFLTDEQKAELKKDRDAVIAANPDLGKKLEDLHQQMRDARDSGDKPSEDLMSQMKAAQDELDAAVIKLDSAAAPIIAEIKAHHHGRGPGPGPGPNGQTDSTSGGGRTPPPDGGN